MPAPFTRRLAGIRFVAQPPELPEKLPRMDIAAFVGFAAAGPLQQPVVLEDAAQFAAIFGDDLPLAWDAQKGAQTFAYLAPAVRAFFRHGGRRCWVIRVAGPETETDFFPLPGLARIDGKTLRPAWARARSAGSWFDAFGAATALTVRTIAVSEWTATTIYARLLRQDDLRPGDLLRLRFTDSRKEAYFRVKPIKPIDPSPPDLERGCVAVQVEPLGILELLTADEMSHQPHQTFELTWERPLKAPGSAFGNVVTTNASPPDSDGDRVALDVWQDFPSPPETDKDFSPPPGTLLKMVGSDGAPFWFQVEESELAVETGSPPSAAARIVGRIFSWDPQVSPAPGTASQPAGERLGFELRVRREESNAVRMIDLGFTRGHARFWNALPNDEQLYSGAPDHEHEALWNEARALYFPLAGDGDPEAKFIPIGMSALAEPTMAAQNSGQSALERDGLKTFSSSLFLDERLLDSDMSTLIADADFIRYQTPNEPHLTGIHAALEIEEASLIAVPDAMHRGWQRAEVVPPAPPVRSPPRAHPSWWHFLECDPPESPPLDVAKPERGQFLKCDLRVLQPPQLSVKRSNATGPFTLEWTDPDIGVEFILEESTEPNFSGANEIWRGRKTTYTIFSRAAGTYYYRVRAEADGESSNWSDEKTVQVASGTGWRLAPSDGFESDALLEIHRALLRFCAARGDIMAVLALPEHFREDDALAYLADLKSTPPPTSDWKVRALGTGEEAAFSYAAIYHPWLIVREEIGGLLWTPPDGAASGVIAARSLARGAWIAPANEDFVGIVSLTPRLGPERYLDLLLAQLNIIRQEPRGFLALSADTLSVDEELRPINVRRLLILLRRAALRLGMTFVFEPNDRTLRRVVQGAFESIMQQLFTRGAFAGATAETSYRVVTDDTLNTPQDFDQGRFRVDLKVAPALPMSFLTVRLVQMGERATATEII